jgi:ankyrin repeat protein
MIILKMGIIKFFKNEFKIQKRTQFGNEFFFKVGMIVPTKFPINRMQMLRMNPTLALYHFCKSKRGDENIKDVESLISKFEVNSRTLVHALVLASSVNNFLIVRALFAYGVYNHIYTDYDDSVFDRAIKDGFLETVVEFVKSGIEPELRDLDLAAFSGHFKIVKYFVIDCTIKVNDEELLISACMGGHKEIVKFLIKHGADPHSNDERPFVESASRGNLDLVKYFIEVHNVNPHAKYNSALKCAELFGHHDVLEYLNQLKDRSKI